MGPESFEDLCKGVRHHFEFGDLYLHDEDHKLWDEAKEVVDNLLLEWDGEDPGLDNVDVDVDEK